MTDAARRIVLGALLLGIGVMFAATVAWRMNGKPLVHDHGPVATAQAPAQMPPAQPAPGPGAAWAFPEWRGLLQALECDRAPAHLTQVSEPPADGALAVGGL